MSKEKESPYHLDDETKKSISQEVAQCKVYKNKGGCPAYWTDERVEKICQELDEFSKKSSSLVIGDFETDRGWSHNLKNMLAYRCKKFRDMYKIALKRIGARREKGALVKRFAENTVAKYSRFYDVEYRTFVSKIIYEEEYMKAKAAFDASKGTENAKGDILEYLEQNKISPEHLATILKEDEEKKEKEDS